MGTSQGCWAVIAATPIMRWAQSLESPHNVTFVDSTSSCDAGGSTATLLLMGTKAGAMPADALVHSSQTREGYRAAFQLPKYIHHASVTKRLCSSVPSLRGLLNLGHAVSMDPFSTCFQACYDGQVWIQLLQMAGNTGQTCTGHLRRIRRRIYKPANQHFGWA